MKGKICIVTGANSGIGKATATSLASLGANLIMHCRNQDRGERRKERFYYDLVMLHDLIEI